MTDPIREGFQKILQSLGKEKKVQERNSKLPYPDFIWYKMQ